MNRTSFSVYSFEYKFIISIAVKAASEPLLPDFVPARSIACSRFSVVKTPKDIGISLDKATVAIPLDTSADT